jgi:hypothetical protein
MQDIPFRGNCEANRPRSFPQAQRARRRGAGVGAVRGGEFVRQGRGFIYMIVESERSLWR